MMHLLSDSDGENMVSEVEMSSSDSDTPYHVESGRRSPELSPDDIEFFSFHRVSRKTFLKLVRMFSNSGFLSYQMNGTHGKVEAADQLSAFLRFAGHDNSSFREIAYTFEISLSSLHRIITRLSYCYSNMSHMHIVWPSDDERDESERYFRRKGLPGVIGVLGYVHIQIDRPFSGSQSYVNNDNFYSIQLQIVCNHKCEIIDIFVGYPGGAEALEVFHASPLSHYIEEKCLSGVYRILASSEYPNDVVTTPFTGGNLSESQLRFNQLHHECSYKIHQCFALLYHKFKQLNHLKLKDLRVISNFVRACCVIHNLSINDVLPPAELEMVSRNADMSSECETW